MAQASSTCGALVGVQVTGFAVNVEKGCIEYIIRVGAKNDVARRRFNEFMVLREDVLALWEGAPELPSKMFATSPQARLPQLDIFLRESCETLSANPPKPLLKFLSVDLTVFADAFTTAHDHNAPRLKVTYGSPKVPEQFRDAIETCITGVIETSKAQNGVEGWKLVGKQAPFEWMARADDLSRNIKSSRVAYGELKRCPPRLIHELMLNNDACRQMEPKIDFIKDIATLDEHTFVQHFVMKSIMFMPPRDVIMVRHWRVLPDGTIIHAEFSIDEFPGVPASGDLGRVRAKLTCGGVVLKPIPNDTNVCKIWRVNDMDPLLGDAIPAYALAKLNEFTASMLSNNMFSLAKLVSKAKFTEEAAKGPLVNWNGSVEGVVETSPILADGIETSKVSAQARQISDLTPYAVGFMVGFASAVAAFAGSKALV